MITRLPVGATALVRPVFADQFGRPIKTSATVIYSSDTPTVATIDSKGKIVAVSPGTCTITATSGSYRDSNTLTVYAPVISGFSI